MFRRDLRLHKHELTNTLMPVMNAFVIACTSRNVTTVHVLKDDRARLHCAALVAHTCARLIGPGVVVCEMRITTADAKKTIARSVCRARIESKHSAIIISESAVHVLLLSVRHSHVILLRHSALGKRN